MIFICKECLDYDDKKKVCTIRYTFNVLDKKIKTPMKRNPNQKACDVFMLK